MIDGRRCFQVKVVGKPPFSMICMEDGIDALAVCVGIFGIDRVEWVR